ncbi:hypothetical protein TNCT_77581 [Trichonephila clavata]|uniref:Secreted protein n=1 Tax=Trichonephila clavata TaxID=2740835 RepID=A0A8X6F820_TRICU|nr:hypothetical protein TNCT_77581 [Trichonephila clavata]
MWMGMLYVCFFLLKEVVWMGKILPLARPYSYFFSLFLEFRKTTQRHSSKRKASRRFVVIRTCGGADENLFLLVDAVSSPTDACCQTFPLIPETPKQAKSDLK